MFRRGGKPTQSAADAERQALFEKLAQRPESVCPFLGLAVARSDYEPQATDEHRCYAFGEPEPVSGEQQRNVCLQRGYANCPRYLRGVLVIPTDELEALRRPPQKVPPPPPSVPPRAPEEGGVPRRTVAVFVLLLLLVGGLGAVFIFGGRGPVAVDPTPTPGPSVNASEPGASGSGTLPTPGASPVTQISGTDSFEPGGTDSQTENGLRLTPSELRSVGAAWFPQPVVVGSGFAVEFSFLLSGFQGDGGDGFAFVVQTSGPSSLGRDGGDLGYGGLVRSLAIEFDTHFNAWPGVVDPNDNHVSIHTNGLGGNGGDHALSLGDSRAIPDLSDGQPHTARIVYVPGTLSVLIDGVAALEVTVDLAAVLELGDGTAFIGFTASTGDTSQLTEILTVDATLP